MCSYTYVKIARSDENGRFDDIPFLETSPPLMFRNARSNENGRFDESSSKRLNFIYLTILANFQSNSLERIQLGRLD